MTREKLFTLSEYDLHTKLHNIPCTYRHIQIIYATSPNIPHPHHHPTSTVSPLFPSSVRRLRDARFYVRWIRVVRRQSQRHLPRVESPELKRIRRDLGPGFLSDWTSFLQAERRVYKLDYGFWRQLVEENCVSVSGECGRD